MGFASSRSAPFLLALLVPAACSLTEEVRTRPGAPGEIGVLGDGGSGGRSPQTGGNGGVDAGRDGNVDGATDGSGGRGAAGAGGRSGSGGVAGEGGIVPDSGFEPSECPVEITFACHDYCGALSLTNECREKLRKSAGVKEDGGAYFPDGSVPHELNVTEMVTRCKCDCELHYRTPACRYDFDQFIMCAAPPLTVVCPTDPGLVDEAPSVIGPCGGLRSSFVRCLEALPPPPPDGGPS